MNSKNVYLAVDLGAESGRVLAGEFDGKCLVLRIIHSFSNGPVALNGSIHWNTLGLYQEILTGLTKAHAEYGSSLQSIGVDSWGLDYGHIDRHGNLLGIPYHYRDERTYPMIDKVFELVGREECYARTGVQALFINTLYQLMAEKENGQVCLEKSDRLLFTPDLINFWLTGEKGNEITIASTSQMLNQATRDWDFEFLHRLGIPTQCLGQLWEPGHLVGPVAGAAKSKIQCQNLPVFTVGSHDTASAVAGVPALESSDFAYLSSGTWSLMGVEIEKAICDAQSDKLGFTNEFGISRDIRYLKNISGLWIIQECRRQWSSEGANFDYDQLTRMAGEAAPFSAVIDVDDPVFSSMGDMPAKIIEHCRAGNQKLPSGKKEIIRTALEGLALKYREVLGNLRTQTGKSLNTIHLVGGGTKNELLNQMTADATGCLVIAGPVEATSVGNLLVQMIAKGELSSLTEGRELVANSFDPKSFEPRPNDRWEEAYHKMHLQKQ
ncbi:MAG: rhamnulokinase [Opitutae bacterium]|nr:rhamnulokinase [Opitutae bacterium]